MFCRLVFYGSAARMLFNLSVFGVCVKFLSLRLMWRGFFFEFLGFLIRFLATLISCDGRGWGLHFRKVAGPSDSTNRRYVSFSRKTKRFS